LAAELLVCAPAPGDPAGADDRYLRAGPNRKDAIILYMTTLPVAEARAQLSKLIERAASTHERFEITRNGQRAAVLLGADDYDALKETIAVLGDSPFLHDHLEGISALQQGDHLDQEGLAARMRGVGRLPATK